DIRDVNARANDLVIHFLVVAQHLEADGRAFRTAHPRRQTVGVIFADVHAVDFEEDIAFEQTRALCWRPRIDVHDPHAVQFLVFFDHRADAADRATEV